MNMRKTARIKTSWGGGFARVKALAIAASAIEICLRKKGKANRPSESERILLGHYIRLSPES